MVEMKQNKITMYKLKFLMGLFLMGLFLIAPICLFAQSIWQSKYIEVNKNGLLKYVADEQGNTIPDFSKVGFYHGQKNIPIVPVVKTLTANENSDDEIKNAIEELAKKPVDKNGFRGAILLKKGLYRVESIQISASGIVLRGEGEETIIIAAGKGKRSLIVVSGTGNLKEIKNSRTSIIDKYVAVGSKSFTVANASN